MLTSHTTESCVESAYGNAYTGCQLLREILHQSTKLSAIWHAARNFPNFFLLRASGIFPVLCLNIRARSLPEILAFLDTSIIYTRKKFLSRICLLFYLNFKKLVFFYRFYLNTVHILYMLRTHTCTNLIA